MLFPNLTFNCNVIKLRYGKVRYYRHLNIPCRVVPSVGSGTYSRKTKDHGLPKYSSSQFCFEDNGPLRFRYMIRATYQDGDLVREPVCNRAQFVAQFQPSFSFPAQGLQNCVHVARVQHKKQTRQVRYLPNTAKQTKVNKT